MTMDKIKNYNFVPFPYFQQLILILQIVLIICANRIKKYLEGFCRKYIGTHEYYSYAYKIILSIPLLLIIYFDIRYSSFALNNIGLPVRYNQYVNQTLWILGAYGIIQVLAQDSGLKTGIDQRDIVQQTFIFFFLGIGMAYSITQNRSQSIIAMFLYLHLKYVVSDRTSNVCFEDLGETITDEHADTMKHLP